jgi:hypothetical protein
LSQVQTIILEVEYYQNFKYVDKNYSVISSFSWTNLVYFYDNHLDILDNLDAKKAMLLLLIMPQIKINETIELKRKEWLNSMHMQSLSYAQMFAVASDGKN